MDFTSDSRIESRLGGSQEGSSNSDGDSSRSELDPEHERLLQLQDTRDSLLAKRNALVREVESLQSRGTSVEFKRTALLDLAELVPGSAKKPERATALQDGSTGVGDEIRYKHDCLPLLNMDLRISYLRDTYPCAELELVDSSVLRVEFTRRQHDYFQVELELPQGPVRLSKNVRWPLRGLESCSNPTSVLQGCYEYDRLRCRRDQLFEMAWSSLQSRGVSHRIGGSLLSLWRNDVLLQLRFEIQFRDVFPQTKLDARLFKHGASLFSPNVHEILQGLMQEYGVTQGVLELCRSCFI